MKILCIDDEADFREDLVEFLEDLGHEVVEAGDGAQGLEIVRAQQPDLIICDRSMPRMTGTELLQTLREDGLIPASLPFLFLTALDDRRDRHAAVHLNPTKYLTKPVDFDHLEALLSELEPQAERGPSVADEAERKAG